MLPTVYELTPKQNLAYWEAEDHSLVIYGGAIRGGKSFWLLLTILSYCFEYPGSRWAVVRRDLPTIKRNTIPSFKQILDSGIGRELKNVNETTLTYTFKNGSEVLFMSESYDTDKELDRFKGLEVNGFGLEELNELQEVTFDKCIERAGSWNKVKIKPRILGTCNPSPGWVKTRIYDPWRKGTLRAAWSFIPASINDNPHISDLYKENLKTLPTYQYEVFVNGNWEIRLKTGGEFYKCFDIGRNIQDVVYRPDLPVHLSFDDNVNPYLPIGIYQIEGKTLYLVDEIAGINPGNTIRSVCNEFIRKYPSHTAGMFIYGDATADKEDTKLEKGFRFYRLVMDNLKKYRPSSRVSQSNPGVVPRGNFINTIFEKGFNGIEIVIGRNCKYTIEDLTNVKEAADGRKLKQVTTDPKTGVSYQKYGHFSDILDYVTVQAFRSDFILYERGGDDINITLGSNRNKNSY